MRRRDERGVALGQVMVFALVLLTVMGAILTVLQYAAAARQASTAADLAALAGARAAVDGGDGCAAAEALARANHATLLSCVVAGESVTVSAVVDVSAPPPGLPRQVRARAIAEPVS